MNIDCVYRVECLKDCFEEAEKEFQRTLFALHSRSNLWTRLLQEKFVSAYCNKQSIVQLDETKATIQISETFRLIINNIC